jgi:hypothetical protein
MTKWLVITTCPIHKKSVHIIVEAPNSQVASQKLIGQSISCPWSTKLLPSHTFKVERIDAVTPYPWRPRETITTTPTPPRPETETEAPTKLQSSHRINDIVDVTITRGNETLSIIYPKNEVQRFDALMAVTKPARQATLINGVLAFLIVHVGTTKSLATGFLQASGFKEATVSSVGEALSRLKSDGLIYTFHSASFVFTRYPIGAYPKSGASEGGALGTIERTVTSEVLGEPMYGISETTRIRILERLKLNPHLAWWRMLQEEPVLKKLHTPVEYEWIKITKPTPSFIAAEDYKRYGPYTIGKKEKTPLTFAYFLVRTGYAEWLNREKPTVEDVEAMFKLTPIEKVKRQATLF